MDRHPAFLAPFDPALARTIDPADLLDFHRQTFGDAQMVAIATAPIVLKDVIFQVGTDSYESAVSSVKFIPTTSQVTFKGLTPTSVFSDATAPVWT